MAEKPSSDFGKRKSALPPSQTPAKPSKRSPEVLLLLMGTVAVGSAAFALMPRECTPAEPGAMPTVSSPSECPPRSSSSFSGHSSTGGYSRYGYYSGGSSGSSQGSTTDAARRGGFGSFAHSFSSHFSFGG